MAMKKQALGKGLGALLANNVSNDNKSVLDVSISDVKPGKGQPRKTFDKEKLEALVMENPNYFYDILPYTYVLGVSDKWIKKFETINIEEPEWYNSMDTFDYRRFGRFIDSTVTSAQRVMTSTPAPSSSGGSSGGFSSGGSSSGGGSSGGGSGGGGGSSW